MEYRYIVRYVDLDDKNRVTVVRGIDEDHAKIIVIDKLFESGLLSITEIRELYNPYLDETNVVTPYERSLLNEEDFKPEDKIISKIEYNMIAQIYGDELII